MLEKVDGRLVACPSLSVAGEQLPTKRPTVNITRPLRVENRLVAGASTCLLVSRDREIDDVMTVPRSRSG